MTEKVRVGIAGLGRSGWGIHAKSMENCASLYQVEAVFDPIEDRRKEAEDRFGCRTCSDFSSLIRDPEVELVVVATPSYLHASQSIEALKAGKHVVCEKPMALNLAEADAMIETAKRTKRILTIFQNKRYSHDFVKVKQIVNSGQLGKIILIKIYEHTFGRRWDWQTLAEFGGGELSNNCPHLIDQALQLFGEEEPAVFCDLQKALTLGDAEDHVKIVLKTKRSPTIDIEFTRACAYPQDHWLIMGTQGGLRGNSSSLRWKYFDPKDLPSRQADASPTPDRSFNKEELPWKEESWETLKNTRQPEFMFYDELYETIRHQAPLGITPEGVRRVIWIIQKCRRSDVDT